MDVARKLKYATWAYIALKGMHVVVQLAILIFTVETYTREGRPLFIQCTSLVFVAIFFSAIFFLIYVKKIGRHFYKLEMVTFVVIFLISLYSTIYGELKFGTSQEKEDINNHVSKLPNIEINTEPTNTINKSTEESTFPNFETTQINMWQETIDFNASLENFSDIINSLSVKTTQSFDFESSSIFPNETTYVYEMSALFTSNSSITSKKFMCNNISVCITIPSMVTLVIQSLLIAVANIYEKLILGNIENLVPVNFHQTEDGEGEVNFGFQNIEIMENYLENVPPANLIDNENSQSNSQDGPPTDQRQE